MRKNIVAGNWKMNKTVSEGVELAKELTSKLSEVPSNVKLIVAPPFTNLVSVKEALKGTVVGLSAQNCANHESGAYTGEVSAKMVASTGAEYVILGHSERREYYNETNEILREKISLALENGLSPIFCVGENLEQRENGNHFKVVEQEIKEVLYTLTPTQLERVIVAYEPIWAIGTGKTATSAQAEEIHAHIRKVLAEKFGQLADEISILYGGSCKPSNAKELFAQPNIDGGLIGGASLKADDFIEIAKSF